MAKPQPKPDRKAKVPGWMVSFGDMMTLVLTFFILLVSLSREQQVGLVARGVGSFVVSLRSFGLAGVLDQYEEDEIFEAVRTRFDVPPEEDPDLQQDPEDAPSMEVLAAQGLERLGPRHEILQPSVAFFAPDSAELDEAAIRYLDRLAPSLRPGYGQVLVLEGRGGDAGPRHDFDAPRLASARARAVAEYLTAEHGFQRFRIEARAWLDPAADEGGAVVDARLVVSKERSGR